MSLEVTVRNNNVEKAMRVLKKKLLKDGMMKELKERQYYSKPSLKKREEKKQAIRRYKKDLAGIVNHPHTGQKATQKPRRLTTAITVATGIACGQ